MSVMKTGSAVVEARAAATPGITSVPYQRLKSRIRKHLLDKFYLAATGSLTTETMRAEIAKTVAQLASEERALGSETERHALIHDIQDELSVSQQSAAESTSCLATSDSRLPPEPATRAPVPQEASSPTYLANARRLPLSTGFAP